MITLPKKLIKPLTTDEEQELWQKWKETSDPKIRERFIMSVYKYCVREAGRCYSNNVSMEDRVNAGVVGAAIAFDRYDDTKGARYATYAMTWIKEKIWEVVGKSRTIVSGTKLRGGANYKQSDAERKAVRTVWLDATQDFKGGGGDGGLITNHERFSSGDCIDQDDQEPTDLQHDVDYLHSLIARANLSDQEKEVLQARWLGNPKTKRPTLRQLGKRLDMSHECVRLMELRAFAKIRKLAKREGKKNG